MSWIVLILVSQITVKSFIGLYYKSENIVFTNNVHFNKASLVSSCIVQGNSLVLWHIQGTCFRTPYYQKASRIWTRDLLIMRWKLCSCATTTVPKQHFCFCIEKPSLQIKQQASIQWTVYKLVSASLFNITCRFMHMVLNSECWLNLTTQGTTSDLKRLLFTSL